MCKNKNPESDEFKVETAIKSIIGKTNDEIKMEDIIDSTKDIDDWKAQLKRESKELEKESAIISAKSGKEGVYKVKVRFKYKDYEVTIFISDDIIYIVAKII